MRRDTVDLGSPTRMAARLKLPSSATRANSKRSFGSMFMVVRLSHEWNIVIRSMVFRIDSGTTKVTSSRSLNPEHRMNILQINSSARADASHSTRLATSIVERLRTGRAQSTLTVRDLGRTPHPQLDEAALQALFTPAEQRTTDQAARVALDDVLIAEIQAADVVVLGVPMYNFGVSAQLKNWIDAISRAKVTFAYTDKGPEGLLKNKKVYVALTRGGLYRNTPADTQVPYLKTIFAFLGMTDVQFVYAEGLAMGPDAERSALASAQTQIDEAVPA
jgi:FMN-dependent NADH-azoreductase